MALIRSESPSDTARRRAKGTAALVERKKKLLSGEIVSAKTVADLSPKQKLFIKYVAEGDSGSAAAERAGCTPSSCRSIAHQWRSIPVIQQEIAKAQAAYAEASQMTKKKVMDMLIESYDMAKLMSEPATMVSAAREVGKLCGFYEPKKIDLNVNVNGSVVLENMNKMSDAELLRIISEASEHGVEEAGLLLDHDDGDTAPE
jgi:hypothetical protein